MPGYLATKGHAVLANGYAVIPIIPGDKAPSVKDWRNVETTPKILNGWLANGKANHGLGIPTKWTPLVDIDVLDKDGAAHMTKFVELGHNFPLVRIGQFPKRGILFRSEVPFKKVSSRWYIDERGRECHVEVLGDGQQFVAFHIHPVTKKPYRWTGDSPENTPRDDLELLTQEQAETIVAEFHRYAQSRGWKPKTTGGQLAIRNTVSDELDLGTDPLGVSEDELRELVRKIPNDDAPYEGEGLTWLNILAAIHHETDGSEVGEEIAYAWSDRSGKHTNERFDKTWNSLGKTVNVPVTARLLIKLAKESDDAERKAKLVDLLGRMDFARDLDELKAVATEFRKIDLDLLDRARAISAFQKAVKTVSNNSISVREARELIRYRPDDGDTPEWLDGWSYLKHARRFYDARTGEMIESEAFNSAFGRFVGPETLASKYALDTIKVPVYHMTIYLPEQNAVFKDQNGLIWLNTYRDTAPPVPIETTSRDTRNIELVKHHFYHLFPRKRDAEILISVCAYIAQTGKRLNWMPIIQGAEGIGKTMIADMMSVVLGGMPHVYKLDTEVLTESTFTDWSVGHLLIWIEELRVPGHRANVLNKLKPRITDDTVTAHAKGINPYNAPNTATYMGATNYRDALPIDQNDTRCFILNSQWQTSEAVKEFKQKNPDYYKNLKTALAQSPGAIRQWLLDYPLHPDFDPVGRAPHSHGHDAMIEEGKSEEQVAIEDLISSGKHPLISDDVLVVHILKEILADDMGQVSERIGKSFLLQGILKSMGYTNLGRPRVDGTRYFTWSRTHKMINTAKHRLPDIIRRRLTTGLRDNYGEL